MSGAGATISRTAGGILNTAGAVVGGVLPPVVSRTQSLLSGTVGQAGAAASALAQQLGQTTDLTGQLAQGLSGQLAQGVTGHRTRGPSGAVTHGTPELLGSGGLLGAATGMP